MWYTLLSSHTCSTKHNVIFLLLIFFSQHSCMRRHLMKLPLQHYMMRSWVTPSLLRMRRCWSILRECATSKRIGPSFTGYIEILNRIISPYHYYSTMMYRVSHIQCHCFAQLVIHIFSNHVQCIYQFYVWQFPHGATYIVEVMRKTVTYSNVKT